MHTHAHSFSPFNGVNLLISIFDSGSIAFLSGKHHYYCPCGIIISIQMRSDLVSEPPLKEEREEVRWKVDWMNEEEWWAFKYIRRV